MRCSRIYHNKEVYIKCQGLSIEIWDSLWITFYFCLYDAKTGEKPLKMWISFDIMIVAGNIYPQGKPRLPTRLSAIYTGAGIQAFLFGFAKLTMIFRTDYQPRAVVA
jgi:hypothetical protein